MIIICFPPETESKSRYPYTNQCYTGGPVIKYEKELKSIMVGKSKFKLSILTDNMNVYTESCK